MNNDSLILWKLKHGKAFLNSFLICGTKISKGQKCEHSASIQTFLSLGLLQEIPASIRSSVKNLEKKVFFTPNGISIFDQLSQLINRGIIYRDESGELEWRHFECV
jgi:hypothetical protein